MRLSGSRTVRVSLRARIRPPSLPEMPTAMAPARVMASATCLLTGPARTISTTSSIAASVTRRPWTKVDWTFSRFSMALICGPPPCATTGFTPTCSSSAMSRPKRSAVSSSPMAWPPYFTTMICSS